VPLGGHEGDESRLIGSISTVRRQAGPGGARAPAGPKAPTALPEAAAQPPADGGAA
jgi:hypothetical protein